MAPSKQATVQDLSLEFYAIAMHVQNYDMHAVMHRAQIYIVAYFLFLCNIL